MSDECGDDNQPIKMSEEVDKWLEIQKNNGFLVPALKYALRNAKKIVDLDGNRYEVCKILYY